MERQDQILKILAWVGHFNGVLPIQNLYYAKTVHELKFKRTSIPYALSWITFVFKLCAVAGLLSVFEQMNTDVNSTTITDLVALMFSFITSVCGGLIVHTLCISGMDLYLDLIISVTDFKAKYPNFMTPINLRNAYVIVNTLLSLLSIITSIVIILQNNVLNIDVVNSAKIRLSYFGIDLFNNPLTFFGCIGLTLMVLEFGGIFLLAQTYVLSESFCKALIELAVMADKEKKVQVIEARRNSSDLGVTKDAKPISTEGQSWSYFSECYIELYNTAQKFEHWISFKFIVIYLLLIVGTISTSFLLINTKNPVMTTSPWSMPITITIDLFRLYTLSNIGEDLIQKYDALVLTLNKINLSRNISLKSRYELQKYLTIVKNAPINLNSKGFFIVRRTNFTSIISTIVTYVIVLLQFRVSEKMEIQLSSLNAGRNDSYAMDYD